MKSFVRLSWRLFYCDVPHQLASPPFACIHRDHEEESYLPVTLVLWVVIFESTRPTHPPLCSSHMPHFSLTAADSSWELRGSPDGQSMCTIGECFSKRVPESSRKFWGVLCRPRLYPLLWIHRWPLKEPEIQVGNLSFLAIPDDVRDWNCGLPHSLPAFCH